VSPYPPGVTQADVDDAWGGGEECRSCGAEIDRHDNCECLEDDYDRMLRVVRRVATEALEADNPAAWLKACQVLATSAELEELLSA
tara:strand:- start:474 stop:731 length:258 start_codon:yes stop_codon:yes gene_type:complete